MKKNKDKKTGKPAIMWYGCMDGINHEEYGITVEDSRGFNVDPEEMTIRLQAAFEILFPIQRRKNDNYSR